ncbi:hypothetical protein LL12F52_36280 [Escherichia coli]
MHTYYVVILIVTGGNNVLLLIVFRSVTGGQSISDRRGTKKAVLADKPELILCVLQLKFDESLLILCQQKRHFFSGEAISPGIH